MKNTLILAVMLSLFFGAVAAQETHRPTERCGDAVCEVAEAQGLYTDLDEITTNINDVSSTLEMCETDYCRTVAENADSRKDLISRAEKSGRAGDIDSMQESLREVKRIVDQDIDSSRTELEEGETDQETVERVLSLEEEIMRQLDPALKKADITSKVAGAIECPDGRCSAEASQTDKKHTDQLDANEERTMTFERKDLSSDTDSDGDGLSDVVERRVEDEGTIYCWGRSCEVPAKADLGDEGSVYCWGKCELPSEVMQTDYDGEVYCWGNRCEPPTEKANGGGKVYSWGSGFPASETLETDPSNIENSSEEVQESISKRSARTGRNPETGKEIQSENDSEDESNSETEGEISDGVNPVNDPPTASPDDSIRNSVSRGVGRLTSAFGNLFGR